MGRRVFPICSHARKSRVTKAPKAFLLKQPDSYVVVSKRTVSVENMKQTNTLAVGEVFCARHRSGFQRTSTNDQMMIRGTSSDVETSAQGTVASWGLQISIVHTQFHQEPHPPKIYSSSRQVIRDTHRQCRRGWIGVRRWLLRRRRRARTARFQVSS